MELNLFRGISQMFFVHTVLTSKDEENICTHIYFLTIPGLDGS